MQVIDEILFTPNGGMNKDVDPRLEKLKSLLK